MYVKHSAPCLTYKSLLLVLPLLNVKWVSTLGMRAQLQKGNRPREAASDIHKPVDQAAATQPWDCETLKTRANGDL